MVICVVAVSIDEMGNEHSIDDEYDDDDDKGDGGGMDCCDVFRFVEYFMGLGIL